MTSPSVTQSSASSGRLNPSMLVMPDSLRHASPQTAQTQYVPTSSDGKLFIVLSSTGCDSPSVTQSSASSGRLNPSMLVMPDSLRHASPQTAQTQYVPTSSDGKLFIALSSTGCDQS